MAQTSKGRRQQLKTQAQATSREMGGVFEDLSKRIGAQFKDSADKAAKAWGSAAKEAASSWYDVEEASKRVGTSEYQNLDYSTQIAAKKKEMWQLDNEITDLTKDQVAERKKILEQDISDYNILQQRAEVMNRENAILMRGQAITDGLQKKWEEISSLAVSTLTTWQGAVVTSALLNKHVGGIAQNMGVAHTDAVGFAASSALLGPAFAALGLDVKASQKALLDNFNSMAEANIANVAHMGYLQVTTGLAADEAAKAARMFSLIEGSNAKSGMHITKQIADQAKLAGAIPSKVIADMTANSGQIAEYWAGNVESLAAAAIQASKLGLSISDITTAAGKMLDIENSIAAEMEAEVLLGRQLNLERAREAALMGDSETLMKELVKNAGSLEQFNSMNVIQRQKLAAALGISVEQLQKMVQEEKTSATTWGKITSEAGKYATLVSGAAPAIMAGVKNFNIMRQTLTDMIPSLSKFKILSGGFGGGGTSTTPAPTPPPAKGPGGMMSGMSATGMLKGAAAMLVMGAALWVAAKGFDALSKVDWGSLWPGAVIALAGLAATMALFGAGPVAMFLATGALVFAGMSAALLLFGVAMMAVGKGIELTRNGLTGFASIIGELIPMLPGMFSLAGAFGMMGLGLMSMSAGLLAMAPMLPVIMAIGAIAKLSGAGAGGGAAEETMDIKSTSIEDKLDALTAAILAQPVVVEMDGRVVGKAIGMSRTQNTIDNMA